MRQSVGQSMNQPKSRISKRGGASLLVGAAARLRPAPTRGKLLRRRIAITFSKLMLPLAALGLLSSIAIWPELDHGVERARIALRQVSGEIEGGRIVNARYHGLDEKGRPFTITAATARQNGPDRIDMTSPKGDMTLENGSWLMLQAKLGNYQQRGGMLDLSREVTLYRDDGTTLVTASASIDTKDGAAAGSEPVHAEGPFGTLHAQGFTIVDRGAAIQFQGPAHLVLSGDSK